MQTLYIDFETYYSTKSKYDLKSLSVVEYIHHPEFYIQGAGIKVDDGPTTWLSGYDAVKTFVDGIDWDNTRVVAHNVKFDGGILAWKFGVTPAQWIDTCSMAKAVLGNSIPSASLKRVAEALGLPLKGELKTNNIKELTLEKEKELSKYCIRDADLCHDIFNALLPRFPDSQWDILDWTVRTFLEPQLVIDPTKCELAYVESIEKKAEAVKKVGVEASVLRSNQQFPELLTSEGFTVPMKKNSKGKLIPALSVQDKGFLELKRTTVPRLQELIAARIAVKQTLEETRAKKLMNVAKVSKYCFDVIFSGAQQTHRFSGGNGCAGNPQNFIRGSLLRCAITVPKGKALIVADFSNIELRVLAFLSRDPKLMSAIGKKEDVYCIFATRIYKFAISKQHKKERMLGKAAVLGLGYGMGWQRFIDTVYAKTGETLTEDFAKDVVKLYRETYKSVPTFWNTCEKVLERLGSSDGGYFPGVPFLRLERNGVVLPSGLKVRYNNLRFTWKQMFTRWKKEWVYDRYKTQATQIDQTKIYGGMMTENLCQAIAGDICKEAINRLIKVGHPPVGQVHDELLIVCDEGEVEEVKGIVEYAMTQAMPWWKELPLEVEIGTGRNWLESK